MRLYNLWTVLGYLSSLCSAQASTTNANGASVTGGEVTVTSVSTLAIVILPPTNSTSQPYVTSITSTTSSSSVTSLALPTVPYTGQAILVGTCNIPQYTTLALQGDHVIEVPLVGCSDDRPECCPSLSPPDSISSTMSDFVGSTTATNSTGPTPTGIVAMLSASPLSICPHDFIDIDPVCCPSGYKLFGQALVGGITPCYSIMSTAVPLPPSASNSIVSELAATATATATISVIVNQVYALGLPCADEPHHGLSTGAKAGIGVAAGVVGLALLGAILFLGICLGRRRARRTEQERQERQQRDSVTAAYVQQLEKLQQGGSVLGSPGPIHTSPNMSQQPPYGGFSPAMGQQGYHSGSHASWVSHGSSVGPPQYQPHQPYQPYPPVAAPIAEMHATSENEIYEAGGEVRDGGGGGGGAYASGNEIERERDKPAGQTFQISA